MPKPESNPAKEKSGTSADAAILARLIERGLSEKHWSVDKAAARAKELHIPKLSARNITAYRNRERTRTITEIVIRRLARVFGFTEESWLNQFPGREVANLLFDRGMILEEQAHLSERDAVTIITSRAFLEATDPGLSKLVSTNLNKGVVYTYVFPEPSQGPYSTAAHDSYLDFRRQLTEHHRFDRCPRIFGFLVDPTRFRFFSDLHTLVHIHSEPDFEKTYGYIKLSRGEHVGPEQYWYSVPNRTWKEVEANLRDSRTGIADFDLRPLIENAGLQNVRDDYVDWFARPANVVSYAALHDSIGHQGQRCVETILTEIDRVRMPRETMKYLDVGCGDGRITAELAIHLSRRFPVDLTMIDTSAAQLGLASEACAKLQRVTTHTHQGRFEEFSPADRYDLITFVHSYYVIDEWYLRKVYDLLAPGGVAAIWLASSTDNVFVAMSEAIDHLVRPGQRRKTGEDLEVYARAAGIPVRSLRSSHAVGSLLERSGRVSRSASALIDFCALGQVPKNAKVAALAALDNIKRPDGSHPITDVCLLLYADDPRRVKRTY